MDTFQKQKQQVLTLLEAGVVQAKQHDRQKLVDQLQQEAEHLREGKLFVVVCGEYKQGKSSLLNALLNERDLFPVDVDITTNLVSTISYGDPENFTVIAGEPGQEKSKSIQRTEIPDYVTEQRNTANRQQARMLMIEAPNQQLKDGLVLVDTPGVGSLNAEHTAITFAFIPNADAILFVSDALAPLTTKELEFIKEKIVPNCKNLIFAVTKIDAVRDYQQIIESDRQKLVQVLECPPENVLIVPVSSSLKLAYQDSQDSEDLEESNFEVLQNEVWRLITEKRGQILLVRALTILSQSIGEVGKPVQAEWEAYQNRSKEELQQQEQQFLQVQGRLRDLQSSNSPWQVRLREGVEDIQAEINADFDSQFREIRRKADQYLEDSCLVEKPDDIAGLLRGDLTLMMSQLSRNLSERAACLQAELENLAGLNFDLSTISVSETREAKVREISVEKSGWWDKGIAMTRQGGWDAATGGVLVGTIGGVLGGALGGALGSLAGGIGALPGATLGAQLGASWGTAIGAAFGGIRGAFKGWFGVRQKDENAIRNKVSKAIGDFLNECCHHCKTSLSAAFRELSRSLRKELMEQIQREQETCNRTLQSLQQARKLSQEQAAQKSKELQGQLKQLEQIQTRAMQLIQEAVSTAEKAARRSKAKPSTQQPQAVPRQPQATSQSTIPIGASASSDRGDWADE